MKARPTEPRNVILFQEISSLQERARALVLISEIAILCIEERERVQKTGTDQTNIELFYSIIESKLRAFFA